MNNSFGALYKANANHNIKDLHSPNLCQAIAFQINNEVFRERVSHLRCCWDVIYEMHSSSHPRLHSIMFTVDLEISTLKHIQDDEKVLQETMNGDNIYSEDWGICN